MQKKDCEQAKTYIKFNNAINRIKFKECNTNTNNQIITNVAKTDWVHDFIYSATLPVVQRTNTVPKCENSCAIC